jgi:hypothetical protein
MNDEPRLAAGAINPDLFPRSSRMSVIFSRVTQT